MMEDFKKQLEKLLLKFPNLPEFTLTVRPRVSIDVAKKDTPVVTTKLVPPTKEAEAKPEKDDPNIGLILEAGITPDKLNFYKKSAVIE